MDKKKLLTSYSTAKSIYFELPEEGQEVKVKFLDVEEVPNNFDGGKTTCLRYHFEVDGRTFLWDRTSRDLAKQMSKFSFGDSLLISRIGEKNKTKYFIRRAE